MPAPIPDIAFINFSSADLASASSIDPGFPAGFDLNDVLVVAVSQQWSAGGAPTISAVDANWTPIASVNAGSKIVMNVWYSALASLITSTKFTSTRTLATGAVMAAFRNVGLYPLGGGLPPLGSSSSLDTGGVNGVVFAGSSVIFNGTTTTFDRSLFVYAMCDFNKGTFTAASPTQTVVENAAAHQAVAVGYDLSSTSPPAVPPQVIFNDSASSVNQAIAGTCFTLIWNIELCSALFDGIQLDMQESFFRNNRAIKPDRRLRNTRGKHRMNWKVP